jgi:segregation and condensation protein B
MELKTIVEALLFAAEKPMTGRALLNAFKKAALAAPETEAELLAGGLTEDILRQAVLELQAEYAEGPRPMQIQEVEGAFRFVTKPDVGLWVRQLFDIARPARLTQPSLETLAIIAYRQPVSRADLEAVRGVSVDGVMTSLLERKFIKIAGRADTPGRPLLYETTPEFLEHFGLKNLRELPNMDELRRMETRKNEPVVAVSGQSARDALTDAAPENPDLFEQPAQPASGTEEASTEAITEPVEEIESPESEPENPVETPEAPAPTPEENSDEKSGDPAPGN